MKIGFQLSSLKKHIQTPQDVLETFKKLRAIGYKYLQIQWIGGAVPAESVKESLDKTGLINTGTQDDFDDVAEHTEQIVERNKLWGGKYVNIGISIGNDSPIRTLADTADRLNVMSWQLSAYGLVLAVHPLFPTHVEVSGKGTSPLDLLWPMLDERIQLQPDFYHIVRAGAYPIGLIEKYQGRIDQVHFKDFKIIDHSIDPTQLNGFDPTKLDNFPVTPVGQGIIPYRMIAETCVSNGVKYCFAEQEAWDRDPFECMKESFDFLVSLGLETE